MRRSSHEFTNQVNGSHQATPDFTDAVMCRLGFERLHESDARRERLRSRSVRAGGIAVLTAVVLMGMLWERVGQEGVATPTLPAAVNQSQALRAQALSGLVAPFQQLERALDSAIDSWGAAESLGIERVEAAPKSIDAPEVNGASPLLFDDGNAVAPFPRS